MTSTTVMSCALYVRSLINKMVGVFFFLNKRTNIIWKKVIKNQFKKEERIMYVSIPDQCENCEF